MTDPRWGASKTLLRAGTASPFLREPGIVDA
jgi:hypothetical protein